MADRTSAGIFGNIFRILTEVPPTKERIEIARKVYSLIGDYDFGQEQMYADDECLALGIARKGIDPDYPEEGETILWPGEPGYENARHVVVGEVV